MVKNPRKRNWPTLLSSYIEKNRDAPFKWGKHDCVCFSIGCIDTLTGSNILNDLSGKWHSKKSAKKYIKKGGGVESMLETVALKHGWSKCSNKQVSRGDLCVFIQEGEVMLSICTGSRCLAPAPKKGLLPIPVNQALYAYKI